MDMLQSFASHEAIAGTTKVTARRIGILADDHNSEG